MSYHTNTGNTITETFDKALTEDYLQLMLRLSYSAMALYDIEQNRITFSNAQVEKVVGVKDLTVDWQNQLDSTEKEALLQMIADALPSYLSEQVEPNRLEACHMIYPIVHTGGHQKWIQHRVVPYRWTDDGYLISCLFHFEDITALPMPKYSCSYRAPLYNSRVVAQAFNAPQRLMDSLGISGRQLQVLRLVALGHSRTAVGHMLNISPHTVDQHRKKLFEKTGTRSIAELVAFANKIKLT